MMARTIDFLIGTDRTIDVRQPARTISVTRRA